VLAATFDENNEVEEGYDWMHPPVELDDFYAMMEIDIPVKKVVIFDRLYKGLNKWMDHVVNGMKQCMLQGLNNAFLA
jgi:hypothetical protein